MTKGSALLVAAVENEGVERIFGVPGEENLDMVEWLRRSRIELVLTRHEQSAAVMAAIHGRLTGRPGVCTGSSAAGIELGGVGQCSLLRAIAAGPRDWPRNSGSRDAARAAPEGARLSIQASRTTATRWHACGKYLPHCKVMRSPWVIGDRRHAAGMTGHQRGVVEVADLVAPEASAAPGARARSLLPSRVPGPEPGSAAGVLLRIIDDRRSRCKTSRAVPAARSLPTRPIG